MKARRFSCACWLPNGPVLDEEQMNWLKTDLEKNGTTTPVIIMCHIPFVMAVSQYVPEWRPIERQ
jgi:hypothetical protein